MRPTYRATAMLVVVAAVVLSTAGCRPSPAAPTAAPTAPAATSPQYPVTIPDDGDTPVTLQAEPQRIISLAPSHTEILFALGLGDRVAGVTTFCDYPPEARDKPKVGEFAQVDLEKIVGLNPDLVLASSLQSQSVVPALRERGLAVAVLEATSVESTLEKITTIGRYTGRVRPAEALVQDIRTRLDAVSAKLARAARKPRVFWELGPDLYTGGKDSFVDGLITLAGGENVGRAMPGEWPQFNLEALVAADPEVIVLADHGFGESAATVRARPGWSGIAAVREGRIVEVEDVNIISRPGPRVVEAVEYIARALHPELFKEGN